MGDLSAARKGAPLAANKLKKDSLKVPTNGHYGDGGERNPPAPCPDGRTPATRMTRRRRDVPLYSIADGCDRRLEEALRAKGERRKIRNDVHYTHLYINFGPRARADGEEDAIHSDVSTGEGEVLFSLQRDLRKESEVERWMARDLLL